MIIGASLFNDLSKQLAVELKYDNPTTNTGHGQRGLGIVLVANAGVGPSTHNGFTRHVNNNTAGGVSNTTTMYHKSNFVGKIRCACAVQGIIKHN